MEYIAGKCNIGRKGRAIRILIGTAFLGAAFIIYFIITNSGYGRNFILMLFPLLAIGFLNIIESLQRFCVFNGLSGTHMMDGVENDVASVSDRAKDKIKSFEVVVLAVVAGAIVSAALYLL